MYFEGYNGNLYVYKERAQTIELVVSFQMSTKLRVYAVHWLTCRLLLSCGPEGCLSLWNLRNKSLNLFAKFTLPYSKERWSTTACLMQSKALVVGDRKGSVHVFCLGTNKPIQTIKRAHSHLGVTSLFSNEDQVFSLGTKQIKVSQWYKNATILQVEMVY